VIDRVEQYEVTDRMASSYSNDQQLFLKVETKSECLFGQGGIGLNASKMEVVAGKLQHARNSAIDSHW
jgi:hypothetical protein